MFATRVWGFDPVEWPVLTFGTDPNRDKYIRESVPGDLVALVGTTGAPTSDDLRGRILGYVETSRVLVETLDVISPSARWDGDTNAAGQFRWPKAILITRAWRLTPPRPLLEVLAKQLPYNATYQAVRLSPADEAAILSLPSEEVLLHETETLRNARQSNERLGASRTFGPRPTSGGGTFGRSVDQIGYTYVFRFGRTDIYKIGWAIDYKERLKEVNKHIPPEVIPERWHATYTQNWPNLNTAYNME